MQKVICAEKSVQVVNIVHCVDSLVTDSEWQEVLSREVRQRI